MYVASPVGRSRVFERVGAESKLPSPLENSRPSRWEGESQVVDKCGYRTLHTLESDEPWKFLPNQRSKCVNSNASINQLLRSDMRLLTGKCLATPVDTNDLATNEPGTGRTQESDDRRYFAWPSIPVECPILNQSTFVDIMNT